MGITYDQYINNPMGGKSAVISMRDLYRHQYTAKWNDILVRENGKIEYKCYIDGKNYYIHMKIPSEVVSNFYYDTLVMFSPENKERKNLDAEATLNNYYVRFFSNDPSFVFTYAHAFIKKDFIIKDLIDKLPKEVIKKQAVERNPINQIGYVKSLYFMYLEMQRLSLFQKVIFNQRAEKYVKKQVQDSVIPASIKIEQRQELGVKASKKKEAVKNAHKNNPNREETLTKLGINPISKINRITAKTGKSKIGPSKSNTKKGWNKF